MGKNEQYLTVSEIALKWRVSERSVRNYCANDRVEGAFLAGKTWFIPNDAEKPERSNARKKEPGSLLGILRNEKSKGYRGGIYHRTQIEFAYNSNRIEGSRLTPEQTRYIFETNTIGLNEGVVNVDDIVETANHFRCVDIVVENARASLTEGFLKRLHGVLKGGTSDSRLGWFAVGDYKRLPNEVGGRDTSLPEKVPSLMKTLVLEYEAKVSKSFEDILDFHVRFERIHPFQDGNGRVGRLVIFKECLRNNIVPFIIEDSLKSFYYRGLNEWGRVNEFLVETCLTEQDRYKEWLDYFRIAY